MKSYPLTEREDIAKEGEIPKPWGLMTVINGKLKTIKDAPQLKSKAPDKTFIAAMLKRATKGMIPENSIKDRINEAKADCVENYKKNAPWEVKSLQKDLDKLKKIISVFEEASGLKIDHYRSPHKKLGEAVKFILDGGLPVVLRDLIRIQTQFRSVYKEIDQGMAVIAPLLAEHNYKPVPDEEGEA